MNQNIHSREATLLRQEERRAASRRRRRVGAISLVLAGMLAISGTVAFLVDRTTPVTNTFTAASVGTEIEETLEGSTKRNVFVENKSDIRVYVRAKVVINWVDKSGNVVVSDPEGYSYTMDPENLPPVGTNWVTGPDGYYYYTVPLAANDGVEYAGDDQTSNLINSITATRAGDDYDLSVQILTEAIQADGVTAAGVTAVQDAWDVTISPNSVVKYVPATNQ